MCIASGFSYGAGYGIRLLPVIQARGQLRDVYGPDVTSEIVQNCGVELVFTPKDIGVAKEISERLGSYTYAAQSRSEEHTSELQSLMRISYAVFCLKKKNYNNKRTYRNLSQTQYNTSTTQH